MPEEEVLTKVKVTKGLLALVGQSGKTYRLLYGRKCDLSIVEKRKKIQNQAGRYALNAKNKFGDCAFRRLRKKRKRDIIKTR